MLLSLIVWSALLYLLWHRFFKLYYVLYYYRYQGIPVTSTPLPFLGTLLSIKAVAESLNAYTEHIFVEYLRRKYPDTKIPPLVLDFMNPDGVLFISDPELVSELYTGKSRYIDKLPRFQTLLRDITGESILFDVNSEKQATRRKHLSVAFYKERMKLSLKLIVGITYQRIE